MVVVVVVVGGGARCFFRRGCKRIIIVFLCLGGERDETTHPLAGGVDRTVSSVRDADAPLALRRR